MKKTTESLKGTMQSSSEEQGKTQSNAIEIPSVSLPAGGGALKGIDEKFQVNASNGTASFSTPLPFSHSRSAFGPSLGLSYNSGSGNSAFGLGWSCAPSSIQRKTDKKLPDYKDAIESDVFLFSGAEDLVPWLIEESAGNWVADEFTAAGGEHIKRYRPRIEGGFARIERIQKTTGGPFYWKVTARDNIVSFFGTTEESRIADPNDHTKIFKWLLDFSYDDKGNCMEFTYVEEDLVNVPKEIHERNRLNGAALFANKYLSSIQHGNQTPFYPAVTETYSPAPPTDPGYFFEAVFDYGDHSEYNAVRDAELNWPARTDAFSEYKSGFEIRTYRLCTRVLFYHYFKELSPTGISEATLVRSIDLTYQHFNASDELFTEADFIISLQQTSYRRNDSGYDSRSLPAVTFNYNDLNWSNEVKELTAENLAHAPIGIGNNYQWTDFYGEGISGIFSEQADGWYYKRNLGNGSFAPAESIASRPSFQGLASGSLQLQDLEADGRKFIVSNQANTKGYFEQTTDGSWLPFQYFENQLNVNLQDPNTKLIDLTGDGKPDVLMTEENLFCWWASKGTDGFEKAVFTPKTFDEEQGSALVFADDTQSIYLADMSGDGLTDIVRIRYSEVCYWPNMGYGQFGAKITMLNAPVISAVDEFDPRYLHLSDISGTGATDLVYLGGNTCKAWFNLSGNAFSEPYEIKHFPTTEIPNNVSVMDFLGNGTGSIVWSSPLPHNAGSPLRYIDLMGGNKPFILFSYSNGFGKTCSIEYKSSTQYYLQDAAEGNPWITKLPFPVQCVSKMITEDEISGFRFTNMYTYHHGYYDYVEKEFRGFGRVEQTDTENFPDFIRTGASNITDEEMHQPVVKTKSWFHTGAFLDREKILDQFAEEYFQNSDEHTLPQPVLSPELTMQEWREALRSCKSMLLRQEVYAEDGSDEETIPYSATENNCHIEMLQPCSDNNFAVFITTQSESITYQYERNASDPRIAHSLNIEIDELGNILQSASVVYGRKIADSSLAWEVQQEQAKQYIVYNTAAYTNDVDTESAYRTRVTCENAGYELTGCTAASDYFTKEELLTAFTGADEIAYETTADRVALEKRKVEHNRTLFLDNDAVSTLPLGEIESLGLSYESYGLAFTDSLRMHIFGDKVDSNKFVEGKYTRSNDQKTLGLFPVTDADDEWWVRSGTMGYPSLPETHFYLPEKYTDPLGSETTVSLYGDYHLMIEKTEDALGNTAEVKDFDFRTLLPVKMQDLNGVILEVAVDILGMVTGSSIIGNNGEGDSLVDFTTDLTQSQVDDFFTDPETHAAELLGNATSRFVYDLTRTTVTATASGNIMREKHLHQLASGESSVLQISFEYSDGMGQLVMKKVQAEPGIAKQLDSDNTVIEVDTGTQLRWIGNGRILLNNKGKPIKQFEPYFSVTHAFETESSLVEIGVSPVLYYDPIGRLIRTDFPNGTFSKVAFDAWQQKSFDSNDTVNDSAWYIERTAGALAANTEENAAATQASVHYNTPNVTHLDSLGRSFYHISHNAFIDRTSGIRTEAFYISYITLDIEGSQQKITDARNNTVMEYRHDMLGNIIYQKCMDTGERWMLNDVTQKALYTFNSKEIISYFEYDALHRPCLVEITEPGKPPVIVMRSEYGETAATPLNYLRGKVYRSYDGSGIITNQEYDFKGNLVTGKRQLTEEYENTIDWTDIGTVNILPAEYVTQTSYDALNRPISITTPDASVFSPVYNEASLLEAMSVNIKGSIAHDFITDINYNEKGQRKEIFYGNDSKTSYTYDPQTFRITRILTTRKTGTEILQDLNFCFDPVGNIISIKDNAQQAVYFNNTVVEANATYIYDAVYRLVKATGREHAGNNTAGNEYDQHRMFTGAVPADGSALQNYCQYYEYDEAGNMLSMIQNGGTGCFTNRWTRNFSYEASSNRLQATQVGTGPSELYTYDVHGNMSAMPHLSELNWNYADHLSGIARDASNAGSDFNTAYYNYNPEGNRVRKIVKHANGIIEERLYLGVVELYTKKNGSSILLQRETLHLMDDKRRVAMVDTKTMENGIEVTESLYRYQYDNHLGTACLETNEHASIISYEEYYPFGSTSYQLQRSSTEVPTKRYRYTGKERDEESGLYYHGARYYAPWLARWTASDPIGVKDGLNTYAYVKNNPIKMNDVTGLAGGGDAHLFGDLGELSLSQFFDDNPGKYEVLYDPSISGSAHGAGGFDMVVFDKEADKLMIIDNKAYSGSISGVSAFEPGHFEKNIEQAIGDAYTKGGSYGPEIARRLEAIRDVAKSGGDVASALKDAGVSRVVANELSKGTATFSSSVFREVDEVLDVRTGGLYSNYEDLKKAGDAWKAAKKGAGEALSARRTQATESAVKLSEKKVAKVETKLAEQGAEELAEKGAKLAIKKEMSTIPLLGFAGEVIFAEEEATAGEIFARGVGAELGIGPIDVTTVYDVGSYAYSEGKEAWKGAKEFAAQTPAMLERMYQTNSTPFQAGFYAW